MSEMIRLQNVEYAVAGKRILSIPDFQLAKGTICGIMGPNGAGKSTLLQLISLLEHPTKGELFFAGEQISSKSISLEQRRKIAIALQQSLLLNMTVFQNIALGLKIRKVPKRLMKEKVQYWLEKFHISHLAHKHAHQLSGGEAQRVNLARAMVLEPELLCLDEPFSALDFPTKIGILKDFKTILSASSTTTVFVSHDLMEIKYLTNELLILMNGEIKQSGKTLDIIDNPNKSAASFINEWKAFSVI
jgi:tungstate transport system ATP-binding protein